MKKTLISILISFLFLSSNLWAGEITGAGQRALEVLQANRISVETLRNQGMQVMLGEVTGGGMKISLDRIQMVVTNKKVLNMRDVSHIDFKHPSAAKTLRDVKALEFNRDKVKVKQLNAIIYN